MHIYHSKLKKLSKNYLAYKDEILKVGIGFKRIDEIYRITEMSLHLLFKMRYTF